MMPHFIKFLEEAREIHIKKNQDYAGKNDPYFNFQIAEWMVQKGLENNCSAMDLVFLCMDGIKLGRLLALKGSGATPNNESLVDTYKDRAIYQGIHASYEMMLADKDKTIPLEMAPHTYLGISATCKTCNHGPHHAIHIK